MKKTQYTSGFECFWKVWCDLTGNQQGKPMAFKYWKRDTLEADADCVVRILGSQVAEKKRLGTYSKGVPCWPWCQRWLSERRYEYIPEPPKKIPYRKAEPEKINLDQTVYLTAAKKKSIRIDMAKNDEKIARLTKEIK